MKREHGILLASAGFGILYWVMDGLVERLAFQEGPLWEVMLLGIPPHTLFVRSMVLVLFLLFGLSLSLSLGRRRRLEQALSQATARFEAVMRNTPGAAVQGFDRQGIIRHWNPASELLYGFRAEEVVGKRLQDILLPEAEAAEFERMTEAIWTSGQVPPPREWPVFTRQGQQRWVYSTMLPVVQDSSVTEVLCLDVDITARRQAEEALRESQERFRLLVDTAFDGISICEYDLSTGKRRLLFCNDRYVEMSGRTREDLLSAEDLNPLVHSEASPEELRDGRARLLAEQPFRDTFSWRRPDGRENVVEFCAVARKVGDKYRIMGVDRDITERVKADQALRESEQRFRMLVDTAFDGINICDYDPVAEKRRLIFCNDRYVELSGYSREELQKADNLDELLVNYWSEEEEQRQLDRMAKGLPFSGICSWKRPDGKENYYEWSAIRVKVGDNYRLFGVDRDITERTRTESALRESEERFRATFDQAAVGIAHVAPDGRWLRVNERFCEILGYRRQELLERSFQDLTHTEDLQANLEQHRQLLAGHIQSYAIEKRYLRKDGSAVWVNATKSLARKPSGEPDYVIAVAEDVTRRRQAEEALRESERRFRLVLDMAFDAIDVCEYDPATGQRRLVFCNDRFVEASGRSREELFSAPNVNAFTRSHLTPEETRENLRRLEARLPFTGTASWMRPDGKENYYEYSAAFIDIAGKYHIIGVDRDITERKKAEEKLRRQEELLQRAARLEAVGKLAGGLAHDFNNILTAILGYSDLTLEKLAKGDTARTDVEAIRAAALRAAALTQQLLAFSRRQVLQPRLLNLNTVVTDLDRLLRPLMKEDVELETALAGDLGPVHADPGQMEQVIMNLAVNARQAMPQGGKLSIATANVELDETFAQNHPPARPGSYVMLAVTDTGVGMDEGTKEHVFEPFFTTRRESGGTGLGLAMVYGTIKQHEGYIWVDSKPGQGSRFSIYLPRVAAAEEPQEAVGHEEAAASLSGHEAVLVVEDEEPVRELLERVLSGHGYSVLALAAPDQAQEELARRSVPFDLLITDVALPGRTGVDFYRRLARYLPSLKVLFISGYADTVFADVRRTRFAGPLLPKPFTPEALLRKVRQVLDSAPAKEGAR